MLVNVRVEARVREGQGVLSVRGDGRVAMWTPVLVNVRRDGAATETTLGPRQPSIAKGRRHYAPSRSPARTRATDADTIQRDNSHLSDSDRCEFLFEFEKPGAWGKTCQNGGKKGTHLNG